MSIHPLFQRGAFGPEEIQRMVTAYEDALSALDLGEYGEPLLNGLLARKILESAQSGERSPERMTEQALAYLGVYRKDERH